MDRQLKQTALPCHLRGEHMKNGRVFVDCFSSLDDVPRKKRSDGLAVLAVLAVAKKFSCFEVDRPLAHALAEIKQRKWAIFDVETIGYPWTKVIITASGREALGGIAHD